MEKLTDIRWYDMVESTNDEARRLISELDNLSVIAARCQTAGRGQGDHKWHSRPGENLTFSAVLKFGNGGLAPLAARDALLITETVTLALRLYLERHGVKARIKWPNDIYVGDRKICGILIENILHGQDVASSIIGIGLNLNQVDFPSDLPNPVSLSQLTGGRFDVEEELRSFHSMLSMCAEKTNTAEGRRYLDDSFKEYVFNLPS
ncbi:MAG: biotin--[acetyl-CoA-carboxylase] ligase [Bacteroidales bacterium]|nr:biotin--[acetyl-CoA-carboxylase] ligase [Bacteroidales bacterium]